MTIDKKDLKAMAEACKEHQPLRFMRSHGALYIRNDNGIVFDVHQNRSFPGLMAQNKDYADLALACTPATILALLGEIETLKADLDECDGERWKLRSESGQLKAERELLQRAGESLKDDVVKLKAENEALRKALDDCAMSLEGEMLQKFAGQKPEEMHPVTRRDYDRDMAELAGYRAVTVKEHSHD